MPNLKPADHHHGAGARPIASASWRRCPPTARFEPLMTLYLTDRPRRRGDRSRQAPRLRPRRQALPGRRHHALGCRRHRHPQGVRRTRRAWRSSACRLLVHGEIAAAPMSTCSTAKTHFIDTVLAPLLERFPGLRVVFEHITTARAVEFVARRTRRRRGDDHAAASAAQSQCDFLRRHPAALLLPADSEARARSAGAARRRDQRQSALFPRHRQRAARARRPRRMPAAAPACSRLMPRIELYAEAFESAGRLDRLRGVRQSFRRGFLRPAAPRRRASP